VPCEAVSEAKYCSFKVEVVSQQNFELTTSLVHMSKPHDFKWQSWDNLSFQRSIRRLDFTQVTLQT